jgi:rubrerythrin
MELEGEKYYLRQAEINKLNALSVVFRMLAEDEHRHAEILQNKVKHLDYKLEQSETISEIDHIFKDLGDLKVEIKEIPNQIDAYQKALKAEKESIDLYTKSLAEATDEESKELFQYLVKQEQYHYTTLEELISLLSKAEEWVENAEFGLRKDY